MGGDSLDLYAYSNTDFAGDVQDRKSVDGYGIFLLVLEKANGGSSFIYEPKYIALSEITRDVLWMRRFLHELLALKLKTLLPFMRIT